MKTPVMDPFDRYQMSRRSLAERRTGKRDWRILEGTMKYQGEYTQIEVINLSDNGAYVIAPCVPQLSDGVTLTIVFPGLGSSIMVTGRVRRVSPGSKVLQKLGGFGLQFTRFYTNAGLKVLNKHLTA